MVRNEFKGKAGTLYLHETNDGGQKWDVWFEDFCIIGCGDTPVAAMDDAVRHAGDISELAKQALNELSEAAPLLTEEESQLVIGAIPLQVLPVQTKEETQ